MENDSQSTPSFFQRYGYSLKGIIIFFLMLILLIPTAMIESIIRERQSRQYEAVNEVAGKWGLKQTLNGPVLVIPYEQISRDLSGREIERSMKYAYLLPDDLHISGEVVPEKRYRGIFEVVVYNAKLAFEGSFPKQLLDDVIPAGSVILWDRAMVQMGIPDLRGLKEQVSLVWDDQA
ncbi:MAG: inner membrane CreD family protein, partial [Saprospiraceae bacterium]